MRKQFKKVEMHDGPSQSVEVGPNCPDSDGDEYAEQYNANQDFAIFAHKDQAVGGIMNLQEKQNIAEDIINQSIDSETSEDKANRNLQKLKQRLSKLEAETYDLKVEQPTLPKINRGRGQMPEDVEMQSLESDL